MSFATGTSLTADRACLGEVKILNVLLCPVPVPSSLKELTDLMQLETARLTLTGIQRVPVNK